MSKNKKVDTDSEIGFKDFIVLPDNKYFKDSPCRGMTQEEVAESQLCEHCPKLIECMHYSVNNPVSGYIAGMGEDIRAEWKQKAYLSGEREGEISRRRCYQHLRFKEKHEGSVQLHRHKDNDSKPDYHSVFIDVSGRLVNQVEPAFEKVEDLPIYTEDVGIGKKQRYRINKNKYIGSEFVKNPDILVIGGVESMPVFTSPEKMWTNLIEETYGVKVNNMSVPYGTLLIKSQNLFYHLKNFGIPKSLIFFLPNISFLDLPISVTDTGLHRIFYNAELFPLSKEDGYVNDKIEMNVMGDKLNIKQLEPDIQISHQLYYKVVQDFLSHISIISSISDILNLKLYYITSEMETDKVMQQLDMQEYFGYINYRKNEESNYEIYKKICDLIN